MRFNLLVVRATYAKAQATRDEEASAWCTHLPTHILRSFEWQYHNTTCIAEALGTWNNVCAAHDGAHIHQNAFHECCVGALKCHINTLELVGRCLPIATKLGVAHEIHIVFGKTSE